MKNKKITIRVLAMAVLLIWGVIIYQVFTPGSEKTPVTRLGPVADRKTDAGDFEYRLLLSYPDPFFPQRKYHTPSSKPENMQAIQPVGVNWPALKYYGCVKKGEEIRAMVTIGGKSLILKPGNPVADQFILNQITSDSLLISSGNETKWFKK
jgi:hypothetical protein